MEAHGGPGGAALPRNDSIAPAWAADVVSSNIVGYHKMELSSGLSILGTQFVEVGGDAISIQSMITDGAAMGDEILFFDGTSYETFPFDDVTFNENWEEAGPGWVDNETGTQAVRAVAPGEGFWYRNGSEKDITVAGEVPAATSVEVTCGGKLQLVSIPLPISVNLQNIKFEGIAATDEVMFFNGTTYDTFPYDEVTFDENWEEAGPGWVDNETGTQAKKVVDLHEGFWLRAAASKVTVSVE